ncbi:NB-ARC domain-containing protein [Lentzea sp. HUAS12]|uniref:ATP-binding protein n=1 Tax=Lentzea sp. HUAS12 TaxID=2951806 RepID=UPI00209E5C39|nr:helix-turn-helix domain-containing protein [Lentzea sp. HUAS12]USX55525.1 NB-ARC domain-containing protein [Lentzea sp. HUAS12]
MTEPREEPPGPSFGHCLLRYRTSAGLSQRELALASGLSVRTLRELEHGRAAAAQQKSTELLATALGLTGDERESFLLLAREGRRRSSTSGTRTMLYGLPAVPALIGRDDELGRLSRAARAGGTTVVVGPPGVGKTSLAVATADSLKAHFPDGCLAVDLRGVDDHPVQPGFALERMLTALGVPAGRIPPGSTERSSLFRTLMRDRRILVVLDNAADEAQVLPLLADSDRSFTIVTCRRSLPDLDAADRAPVQRLVLDVLPEQGAVDLLATIVGEEVVLADPAAAKEVVGLCGHLPLAVRIVGNRLATRRHWSLPYLAGQLRDERRRLDSLAAGDLRLRPAFELSLRRLSPAAQEVFRRLALIPGAHFSEELAAVVAGVTQEEVEAQLDELVEASLLTVTTARMRLQFHDLLRLFARERLAAEEPRDVRARLHDDLLTHVLRKTTDASRLFLAKVTDVPQDSPFRSQDEAKEWLEQESTNWVPVVRGATEARRYREVVDCTWALYNYAHGREPMYPWTDVFGCGVRAARELGDRRAEVNLLAQYGMSFHWSLGDSARARTVLLETVALAEEIDHTWGAMIAHSAVGWPLVFLGEPEEAVRHADLAFGMSDPYDFFETRFWMHIGSGGIRVATGRFAEALTVLTPLLAEVVERIGETNPEVAAKTTTLVRMNIADCLAGLGRWQEAAEQYHEVIRLFGTDRPTYRSRVELLVCEGTAWRQAGDLGRARECLTLALDLCDDPADRAPVEAELALLPAEEITTIG